MLFVYFKIEANQTFHMQIEICNCDSNNGWHITTNMYFNQKSTHFSETITAKLTSQYLFIKDNVFFYTESAVDDVL